MALLYVWLPSLVFGHLLAACLLLYGIWHGLPSLGRRGQKTAGQHPRSSGQQPIQPHNLDDVFASHADLLAEVLDVQIDSPKAAEATVAGQQADEEAPNRVALPVTLAWDNLECELSVGSLRKKVLTGATGQALPGELVGFLGPSGAGKSTLLDILAGRKTTGRVSGTATYNGCPLDHRFKRLSAYVPQEDVFIPTLSVSETLHLAARLSLPAKTSKASRAARCHQTLATMGLLGVQHHKVGGALPGGLMVRGISGGEKRRLRISCALVAAPSVLFMDEPTSGLDAHAAWSVMNRLAILATQGHTLCASLHQPRNAIWDCLHKVAILSDGRCLYFGRPDEVLTWFSGKLGYPFHNPGSGVSVSDWIIDLVSTSFIDPVPDGKLESFGDVAQLGTAASANCPPCKMTSAAEVAAAADAFNATQTSDVLKLATGGNTNSASKMSTYAVGWHVQYSTNLQRCLLAQFRNPTDSAMRLLLSLWVGLLAGLVFYDPQPRDASHAESSLGLLFFLQLAWALLPFMYMSFLQSDRQFYVTDVANGLYHPSAYYAAMITAQTPAMFINTVLGSLVAYGMGNLNHSAEAVVLSSLLMGLAALTGMQMLTFCTLAAPNSDLAFAAAVALVSAAMLLSANEMGSLASPTSCAPFGDQVLGQIGMHDFGLGVAFGAQLGFYALWVSLGYLALLRLKERR